MASQRMSLMIKINFFYSLFTILTGELIQQGQDCKPMSGYACNSDETKVIVITPTYKRAERLADMTRLAQTLMHIRNLHWIVVEDGDQTSDLIKRLLQRSKIDYLYFSAPRDPSHGEFAKGWSQRNFALQYIRWRYNNDSTNNAVVYFADDDNSYDIRLFDAYIKKVKTIGFWAVGLSGEAKVEAPHVENGKIVSWDVQWAPEREFAIDMAGFGINLNFILNSNAWFHSECKFALTPETCFLSQFGMQRGEVEVFGHNDQPKEVLVWHTQTKISLAKGPTHNYDIE